MTGGCWGVHFYLSRSLEVEWSPPPPLSSRVVWSSWINLQLVLNQTWIRVKYCKRRSAAALLPRPLQLRKIVLSCSCWEATSNTSTLKQLGHKRAICLFQHPASFMLSMALRQRGRNDEAGVSLGWGWIANQTEQCLPRGPGPRGATKDSQQLFEIGTTEEQFNSDRSRFHFVSSVSNNKHRENITIAVNSSGSILKARHEKVVLG